MLDRVPSTGPEATMPCEVLAPVDQPQPAHLPVVAAGVEDRDAVHVSLHRSCIAVRKPSTVRMYDNTSRSSRSTDPVPVRPTRARAAGRPFAALPASRASELNRAVSPASTDSVSEPYDAPVSSIARTLPPRTPTSGSPPARKRWRYPSARARERDSNAPSSRCARRNSTIGVGRRWNTLRRAPARDPRGSAAADGSSGHSRAPIMPLTTCPARIMFPWTASRTGTACPTTSSARRRPPRRRLRSGCCAAIAPTVIGSRSSAGAWPSTRRSATGHAPLREASLGAKRWCSKAPPGPERAP